MRRCSSKYARNILRCCPPRVYSALTTEAERLRAIQFAATQSQCPSRPRKPDARKAEQSLFELEQILKTRLAELAQADQRTNEFLAMLGHELRNPLSPQCWTPSRQRSSTRRAVIEP